MSQRSSMVSKSPDKGKYPTKRESKPGSVTSRNSNTSTAKISDKENHRINNEVVDLVNRKCALLNDKMTYMVKQINDVNKEISVIKNSSQHSHNNSQFNSIVSGKLENSTSNSFSKTTENEKLDSKSSILEQKINYLYSKCNKL